MRIDSLKNSPDRAGRYWVTFDDGTKIGLYRQTVEDFGLYIGKELTEEEKAQLLTAAGKMSAKMRAVRIVSATSVSKRDLEERLVRKGEDPEQAKEAVRWMEDLHLVDDRNTAEQVVHACISKAFRCCRSSTHQRNDSSTVLTSPVVLSIIRKYPSLSLFSKQNLPP